MMAGQRVLTTQNAYTRLVMRLCPYHYKLECNGDSQVTQGLHFSSMGCDACRAQTVPVLEVPQS
jgi:hypothetical protein